MDDRQKAEEQVEDLDIPENETDDVRGGASPQIGPQVRAPKWQGANLEAGNLRSVDGGTVQHNETLVQI